MSTQANATLSKLSDSGKTVADARTDVRGLTVTDRDGNDIGKVEDLFIDEREQKVRFLLVEHGGFLGLGETKSLIPVDAITRITEKRLYINHARYHVAKAPRYDPALVNDHAHSESIYTHYGYNPYWATAFVDPIQ
jgi:sporulation protein YlmC with PRC-barrel domain